MPSRFLKLFSSSKQREAGYAHEHRAGEDLLEMLRHFDTVIVVDDSGSMMGTRWKDAKKALQELAPVASKYDSDGIEIQFLNSNVVVKGVKTASELDTLFKVVGPYGGTPIGRKLQTLLNAYIARLRSEEDVKPVNYIVITDGAANDGPGNLTVDVVINASRELDNLDVPLSQVGIQFVQIGDDDEATRWLERLDDELVSKDPNKKNDHRDIVDTILNVRGKRLDLVKALTGGINRKIDAQARK